MKINSRLERQLLMMEEKLCSNCEYVCWVDTVCDDYMKNARSIIELWKKNRESNKDLG